MEAWKETQAEAEKGVEDAAQGPERLQFESEADNNSTVPLFSNPITVLYVRCMILHQ